jgi:hypothetical protein
MSEHFQIVGSDASCSALYVVFRHLLQLLHCTH